MLNFDKFTSERKIPPKFACERAATDKHHPTRIAKRADKMEALITLETIAREYC